MMVGMNPNATNPAGCEVYATTSSGERIKLGTLGKFTFHKPEPAVVPDPIQEIAPASVTMQFTADRTFIASKLTVLLLGIGRSRRSRENSRRRRDIGRAARRARNAERAKP